jgi:hemolysin activation/secretion protein
LRLSNQVPLGAAIVAASLSSLPAAAQIAPGALPSREQIELPRTDAPQPRSGVTVTDETQRAANCPFDASIAVEISRLRFTLADGSPLPGELAALLDGLKPGSGKQPLPELCRLRDDAAALLSSHGYITGVTIPPQEITDGEARLIVIPAKLTDVRINGKPGRNGAAILARIEQLKTMPVLNTRRIESVLMTANDVPGTQVAMALRSAGTAPGDVIGELNIASTPFTILANVQNSGSKTIGRESGSIRAEVFGLTGMSDRTFIGISSTFDTDEQQVVQAGHYFGFDSGLTIGGRFSYAWSRPDLGALDLRSRSLIGGLDLSQPLYRSVRANADIGGGFEIIEQRIKFYPGGVTGGLPLTRDKLRVAYLRLSGSKRAPQFNGPDAWGVSGSIELRQGFDIFDATQTGKITPQGYGPSRFEGSATATVIRGGFGGFISLGRLFSISTTVQGQWASGPLLSFEEFSVGNLTIGRGYDPGVTSGDKALGIRIEPRVQLPIKSRLGVQAFAFYDSVRIWNDDLFTTERDRSLQSWGGGMRFTLPGMMALEATYARPEDPELNLPGARRASDRVLLSLTAQFAPRR